MALKDNENRAQQNCFVSVLGKKDYSSLLELMAITREHADERKSYLRMKREMLSLLLCDIT